MDTPLGEPTQKIAATQSLAGATSRHWPVIVVGAGPAGGVLAGLLARSGQDVLLVDRAEFPRWKVCGCYLNAAALFALDQAGLGHLTSADKAQVIRRLRLFVAGQVAEVPVTGGVNLSRETLDVELIRHAMNHGAAFQPGTQATWLGATDDGLGHRVRLRSAEGEAIATTAVLVLADGLAGTVLGRHRDLESTTMADSRMGIGTTLHVDPAASSLGHVLRDAITMTWHQDGYVGVAWLEDGRLDIAGALDRDAVRRAGSPEAAALAILDSAGIRIADQLTLAHWQGTPLLTRHRQPVAESGLFAIGDAARFVEPFTGEGLSWALQSGVAASGPVAQAIGLRLAGQSSQPAEEAWRQRHRQRFGKNFAACRSLCLLLRRGMLVRPAHWTLRRLPTLASPLVHFIKTPRVRAGDALAPN